MRDREQTGGDIELAADERDALAAWQPPAPPDGFADRVVAARAAAPAADEQAPVTAPAALAALAAPPRDPGRRRRAAPWLVVAAAAAGALAVAQLRSPSTGAAVGAPTGRVTPAERRTVRLGGRAVAVLEAGADLAWVIDDGVARVTQRAGDVFYRVERGGAFEVDTPRGTVRVTGTCFRLELSDMKTPWQGVAGAAIGAVLVVTVYEGSVLFAGAGGEARPVSAGQVLTAEEGETLVADARPRPGEGQGGSDAAAIAAPGADVTRDELLRRDAVQRAEIAGLRAHVRELGQGGGARVRRGSLGEPDPGGRPWFDPSKEELVRFAEECRLRADMPPLLRPEPYDWGPRIAEEAGLSSEELAAVNAALAAFQRDYVAELRALYIEITGDAAGADDLSAQAMASEIADKSPEGEEARVGQRIARERAGLVAPPAPGAPMSPIERHVRRRSDLGSETERVIAGVLGAERARAIREKLGGWGMRQESVGCPPEGE